MNRTIGVFCLFLLSASTSAWACLWYYGTGLESQAKAFMGHNPKRYVEQLTNHSGHDHRVTMPLPADPGRSGNFRDRSDLAVTLVYKGETARAIEILKEVEEDKPGEYVVAANLGTAYELHGDLAAARKWVTEGIRRNPNSHDGSEWLHVLILDARIALVKDPNWLASHSVLGLDFGNEPAPLVPKAWPKDQDGQSTIRALQYQLHERMGFVRPPDPLVGNLIADLGNALATAATVEHAIEVYDLAMKYQAPRAEILPKRQAYLREMIEARYRREMWTKVACISGGALFLGFLVFWTLKRRAAAA